MSFFLECGFYGWPLLIMTIVNLVLAGRATLALAGGQRTGEALEPGLQAILFWGVVGGVTGFLGQYHGMYNALRAIRDATAIDPRVVAMGLAESFGTVLWGLLLFILSALAWFGLSGWNRRRSARMAR